MKQLSIILIFLFTVFIGASGQRVGNWEKLGERSVNFKTEKDVIGCSGSKTYKKLKIRVEGAPVEFHKVIVNFQSGASQDISIRKSIKAGEETRVIDLKGNKRIIRNITFFYKSIKEYRGKKATVSVWAER